MASSKTERSGPASVEAADEALPQARGQQIELPQQFSAISALSFAYIATNSWIGYSGTFVTALLAGGGPAVFYGVIAAGIVCTIITLGLAELASAFPSSGGQYHFTFMVSSPKTRTPCAFVCGWLSCLAWCLGTVSGAIFTAQAILALVSFLKEDYQPRQWQTYLVFLALITLATAMVCLLAQWLPRMQEVMLWSSISAFVEVPDPGRTIPKVMWLTPVIGIATAVPFVVATLFATVDLGEIVRSDLPILTLYHQATGSKDVATIFTVWLIFNYFGGTIAMVTTSGRMAWAFARDNGLPISRTLATVHPRFQTPVASTVACAVLMALYGLVYIASSTAYSSIVSMAILSMNVTYVIPQGIVLFRGREKVLVDRYFDLGRYGVFVNAFSCLWVGLYTVIFCFPTIMPPTPSNMNYLAPVVVVIIVLILAVWYGGKKKTFSGPSVVIAEALAQESSIAIVAKRESSP
ncbi:choline transport protein [Aspergillus udagawae]|uniref:Choline transport protein n=1 Tax=Aspergillus udagawae TaxID=91492 RepID=A0A8H3RRH3_9EURO|nr:choline transport protein [Aspergillus udagawae]